MAASTRSATSMSMKGVTIGMMSGARMIPASARRAR